MDSHTLRVLAAGWRHLFITVYIPAARLAALAVYGRWPVATNSVTSDRIKAALPLIALKRFGCGVFAAGTTVVGRRVCLRLNLAVHIAIQSGKPPLTIVGGCSGKLTTLLAASAQQAVL